MVEVLKVLEQIFEVEFTPFQDVAPVLLLCVCLSSLRSFPARSCRTCFFCPFSARAAPGEKKRGEPASVLGPLARH